MIKSIYLSLDIQRQIKKLARKEKISLNRWVLDAVAKKMKREEGLDIDISDRRFKGPLYREK
jgi:hypothetical protein